MEEYFKVPLKQQRQEQQQHRTLLPQNHHHRSPDFEDNIKTNKTRTPTTASLIGATGIVFDNAKTHPCYVHYCFQKDEEYGEYAKYYDHNRDNKIIVKKGVRPNEHDGNRRRKKKRQRRGKEPPRRNNNCNSAADNKDSPSQPLYSLVPSHKTVAAGRKKNSPTSIPAASLYLSPSSKRAHLHRHPNIRSKKSKHCNDNKKDCRSPQTNKSVVAAVLPSTTASSFSSLRQRQRESPPLLRVSRWNDSFDNSDGNVSLQDVCSSLPLVTLSRRAAARRKAEEEILVYSDDEIDDKEILRLPGGIQKRLMA